MFQFEDGPLSPPECAETVAEGFQELMVEESLPVLRGPGGQDVQTMVPGPAPAAPVRVGQYDYLGQIANTYLVLREGSALTILDQHAVHERILMDRFRRAAQGGARRGLLLPLRLRLHPTESERALAEWDNLDRLGFGMRLEGNSLEVLEVPDMLERAGAEALLREILAGQRDDVESVWISASCKAAIKAGDPLTPDEAAGLIQQWIRLPDRDHCPHGRPCRLTWSASDLERLFKRI